VREYSFLRGMAIEKVFEMSIISVDMKNLAVANALALNNHAIEAIASGASALERSAEYAKNLPQTGERVLLLPADENLPGGAAKTAVDLGFRTERFKERSIEELLKRLQALAAGYDNLFYFFADCPLLDWQLSARMLENHRRYYADYTFADGFPYGLSPEILKPAVLPALLALAERSKSAEGEIGEKPIRAGQRNALFELIKKDINAFDIETELSPVDLRMLRAELCADSKRNLLLVQRVIDEGAGSAEQVCRILQDKAEILRTLPAFFNIQIVAGCPQLCTYCPYPRFAISKTGKQGEMDPGAFAGILDGIQGFCEEATISVSLWGEPAYHSRFADLAAAVAERHLRFIVETSGIGWSEQVLEEVARSTKGGSQLDWIVSLDTRNPEEYEKLRGQGYEEAHRSVEVLQRLFPGHVYPQAVRMKDNEEGLESFYRYWKEKTGRVIVQKYDPFCGFLPDRRVTDLSPLKRFPCWHIKREMAVLIDGTVGLCREDLKTEHRLGNVFEQSLEEVWAQGDRYYRDHLQERYPELCRQCDEYYSFNF